MIRRRLEHYRSADQQLDTLALYHHVIDSGNRVKETLKAFSNLKCVVISRALDGTMQ